MNSPNHPKKPTKFADLLDPRAKEKTPEIATESPMPFQPMEVPIARIVSREVHEAEKRDLWAKVWQFACREDHVANVGDQYVYDIADKSYLIVRSAPDRLQAFENVCLHRGRTLRDEPGNAPHMLCPYHSFTWNLDGSLKSAPCGREFLGRSRDEWHLPEIQIDSWEGFVFVNPDNSAAPLSEFLGEMPKHFARWNLKNRALTVHVVKKTLSNWKLAQEAFMEALHVSTTHPQSLLGTAGEQSQYDVFGNFSRAMTWVGLPSSLVKWTPTEQELLDGVLERTLDSPVTLTVPEGMTARDVLETGQRERLRALMGDKVDDFTSNEMVDLYYYTLFPNFHPWGAFNEIVYRFRPNGDDHRSSIMEIMLLSPVKEGEPIPPPVPPSVTGFEGLVADDPTIGALGRVFDQDLFNLPMVQKGLEATSRKTIILSAYQEMKIRHFYKLLDRWVS